LVGQKYIREKRFPQVKILQKKFPAIFFK